MKSGTGQYGQLLDDVGMSRVCCRRMFLTHVDTVSDILQYSQKDEVMDESGTVFLCEVKGMRTVTCS